MPLTFAAIVPHPPLLIPTIGKEAIKKIEKTKLALEKLEEDLYLSHPDVIVVISPHGHLFADAFTINLSETFETDFKEFGDLITKLNFKGEKNLPNKIRSIAEQQQCRTIIITEKTLDHGAAVPLCYLTKHLPNATIMPVGYSELDGKTHLEFGSIMKEEIMRSNSRIAVIASGDLSHALTTDAPAGFNQAGAEFDKKIQELLASHNTAGMLQLNNQFISDAAECGFKSFLILMGILRDINYTYESYAYEGPFGVGYLTANFVL